MNRKLSNECIKLMLTTCFYTQDPYVADLQRQQNVSSIIIIPVDYGLAGRCYKFKGSYSKNLNVLVLRLVKVDNQEVKTLRHNTASRTKYCKNEEGPFLGEPKETLIN